MGLKEAKYKIKDLRLKLIIWFIDNVSTYSKDESFKVKSILLSIKSYTFH